MPARKIYLDYEVNNILTNAYSVTLASEDETYGVKDYSSGNVIVPNGASVSNPSEGKYEKNINVDDTKIYIVSWKIIPEKGDQPKYDVQIAGPFTPNASKITASTDYKGTFRQGTTATLMLKITNFDGIPQNASGITISIKNSSGVTQESGSPEKPNTGLYVYDWDIPSTQTVGDYEVYWLYTVDGVQRLEKQDIVVAKDATDTDLYSGSAYELRLALEYYLGCAQAIPVYYEQGMPSADGNTMRFTFPRWNQTAGIKVFRNGKTILTTEIDVDYFRGEVRFQDDITDYDNVYANYNFRWFDDSELHLYLENAVRTLNAYPPHSGYTINNISSRGIRFVPGVLQKAATDALRKLMMCLQFQEPQQVFGGNDKAQKAFSNLESLKKNYEEEWKIIFENKKYGPYVGLTRSIVTPSYTLPGGRSRWFRYLFSGQT